MKDLMIDWLVRDAFSVWTHNKREPEIIAFGTSFVAVQSAKKEGSNRNAQTLWKNKSMSIDEYRRFAGTVDWLISLSLRLIFMTFMSERNYLLLLLRIDRVITAEHALKLWKILVLTTFVCYFSAIKRCDSRDCCVLCFSQSIDWYSSLLHSLAWCFFLKGNEWVCDCFTGLLVAFVFIDWRMCNVCPHCGRRKPLYCASNIRLVG